MLHDHKGRHAGKGRYQCAIQHGTQRVHRHDGSRCTHVILSDMASAERLEGPVSRQSALQRSRQAAVGGRRALAGRGTHPHLIIEACGWGVGSRRPALSAALDAPCRLERGPGSGFYFYRPRTRFVYMNRGGGNKQSVGVVCTSNCICRAAARFCYAVQQQQQTNTIQYN